MSYHPSLNLNEVHLWIADLDLHSDNYVNYKKLLNADEAGKESKFATEKLRRFYTISRGILRKILQQYLHQKNEEIDFFYGKNGKPFLINNPHKLQFNVSHSQKLMIYGISTETEIGVDIEYFQPEIFKSELLEYVLSHSEKEAFNTLGEYERPLAFYYAWTRKEAFLKAQGVGLSKPLESVEVSFKPSERPRIVSIDGDKELAKQWSVYSIMNIEEYVGAIVAQVPSLNLKIFHWPKENSCDFAEAKK